MLSTLKYLNPFTNFVSGASRPCVRQELSHSMVLAALPYDLLIDHILSLLYVRDILSLRTTNKFFYILTCQPAIWKRLLDHHPSPLPPLPPTACHSLGQMSALEAETLLYRALTFLPNWSSPEPIPYDTWTFDALYCVSSMTMLPGGHYLVASVSTQTRTKYYVMLFAMDYAAPGKRAYPLATVPVKTKAYDLHAKYMYVNGESGIVISYTRRQKPKHNPGPDPSLYSDKYEIDDDRLNYETVLLHTPLSTLDRLSAIQPAFRPGTPDYRQHLAQLPAPFTRLETIRSTSALCCPSLDYLDGQPYFSIVKRPGTILLKDLDRPDERLFLYECSPPPAEDCEVTIITFRHLPLDRKLLIAKRFYRRFTDHDGTPNDKPTFSLGLYPAVYDADAQQEPLQTWTCQRSLRSIHISEPPYSHLHSDSQPLGRKSHLSASLDPPVISIYCRLINPDMFLFLELPPTVPPFGSKFYTATTSHLAAVTLYDWRASLYRPHFYDLSLLSQIDFSYPDTFGTAFILPGTRRALFWEIPLRDRRDAPKLLDIFSFVPIYTAQAQDKSDAPPSTRPNFAGPSRKECFAPVGLESSLMSCFADGVQAVAWDEHIGRVCLCAAGDSDVIVLDFARMATEAKRDLMCLPRARPDHGLTTEQIQLRAGPQASLVCETTAEEKLEYMDCH